MTFDEKPMPDAPARAADAEDGYGWYDGICADNFHDSWREYERARHKLHEGDGDATEYECRAQALLRTTARASAQVAEKCRVFRDYVLSPEQPPILTDRFEWVAFASLEADMLHLAQRVEEMEAALKTASLRVVAQSQAT